MSASDADDLRSYILQSLCVVEAAEREQVEFGKRFTVDIRYANEKGSAVIRTLWIILNSDDVPRFTSCYIV